MPTACLIWRPPERAKFFRADCARCDTCAPSAANCPPPPAPPCSGAGWAWWMPAACPRSAARSSAFSPPATDLALAAALEDPRYPLDELIYDLANLDAGFRFCGEENRWAGQLAVACHQFHFGQAIHSRLSGKRSAAQIRCGCLARRRRRPQKSAQQARLCYRSFGHRRHRPHHHRMAQLVAPDHPRAPTLNGPAGAPSKPSPNPI